MKPKVNYFGLKQTYSQTDIEKKEDTNYPYIKDERQTITINHSNINNINVNIN